MTSDIERILALRLPLGCTPRPFQIDGIQFVRDNAYRALIGDDMGLGKGIQALCSIVVDPKELLPALVICPAAMFYTWREETKKWLPTVPIRMLDKTSSELPDKGYQGLLVTTWTLLSYHAQALASWGVRLIVADESHYSLNPDTARSKAFCFLAHRVPHVLALSGTPLRNNRSELWHLLHVLDKDGFPSLADFERRFGSDERTADLRAVLKKHMIRRLKKDVLQDLPDKQRVFVPIELDADMRAEYDQAEDDFRSWLQDQTRFDVGSVASAAMAKIMYLRRLVGEAKAGPAIEFLLEFVQRKDPVVVFCEHLAVLQTLADGLEEHKVRYGIIRGETSKTARQKIIMDFQAGRLSVVLGTQAMKEGITLTRASDVVFVERWWTPADEEQAEDRAHRIGQKSAVTVWFLHAPDTVDDKLRAFVDAKRVISMAAIGGTNVSQKDAELFAKLLVDWRSGAMMSGPKAQTGGTASDAPTGPQMPPATTVQSLLFDRSLWTLATARHWARMHGLVVESADSTPKWRRLTIQGAKAFRAGSFRARKLTDTVTVVIGRPKGGRKKSVRKGAK